MNSKLKDKFKKDWIGKVSRVLNIKDTSQIEYIFDKNFKDSTLNIYNSVRFKDIQVPSVDFYYGAPQNFIVSENGRLFWRASKKKSVFGEGIVNKMGIRQIFKKIKMEEKAKGNSFASNSAGRTEKNTKTFINALYGQFGYTKGYFFNIDVADSVTCGGRNVIAVASIINELYGGDFKFYLVNAHIKLIEHVLSEDCVELNKKYTMVNATTDMCVRELLGSYYDSYYAKSALISMIDNMTQEQKNVLYYKNNLKEAILVPEINTKIKEFIKIAKENGNLINENNGVKTVNINKHPLTKDLCKELNDNITELCYGLYYYDGDYIDGIYRENLEYVVRNIKRKKIALMDTDSNVTVLSHERDMILETFASDIGESLNDRDFTQIVTVLLVGGWYIAAIQHGFKLYARRVGVEEEHIPMIDLECEYIMDDCQLTIYKKNYTFKSVLHDFTVLNEFVVKGMKYTKADSNAKVAELVDDMMENDIIIPTKDLDYKKLYSKIKHNVDYLKDYMTSLEFLKNDKTIIKLKDTSKLVWGEYRVKAVRLWRALYPDIEIEVPGAFGIVRTNFTQEYLDRLKVEYPDIYNILSIYAKDLSMYNFANKYLTRYDKVNNSKFYNSENEYISKLHKVLSKYNRVNFDDIKNILEPLYDEYYEKGFENIKKEFGFSKHNIDKTICGIEKIALPIDIAELPSIFAIFDGMLFDTRIVSELEHLVAPAYQTLSCITVKNKNKRNCCTNVLATF